MMKMNRLRISLVICSVLMISTAKYAVAETGWKAGVAREKITPAQPMRMSGYAGRDKAAEGTIHDLWAKALVLEDPDGQQLLLISLDLVGIGRDISVPLCAELQKAHGLQRSQISISTSHTHTGPVVGRNLGTMYFLDDVEKKQVLDYSDALVASISKAAAAAFANRKPATISYGLGTASFAVNRRNNREADVPVLRAAGELKGPVDHSVAVMSVRNAAGELTAVTFGYACHATVLGILEWTGDWPGFAQIEIEKRHPGAVALFVAGCGADQNPLPRRTVELAEGYGRDMATAVDTVLAGKMKPVQGHATHAYREIDLELGTLPTREQLQTDTKSTNKYIASRANDLLQTLNTAGALDQTYPYPVQVWGIGNDARTVFLGGEVVVDFSVRLRSELSDRDLWVAAYCNDVMAYIPSLRVLREGGYEGDSSMIYYGLPTVWSERVEEHIVETVHQLLKTVDTE